METVVDKKFEYVRGNLMLTAYHPKVGVFKEDTLILLYNRLKEQGLWDIAFHEDTMMTVLDFMNFFTAGNSLLQLLCIVKGQTIVDIAGMAWLADVSVCQGVLTRAMGAFVFFKDYQKPIYTDQFSEMGLEYWFEVLNMDVVFGVTPEPNRAALIYSKRSGAKEVGRVPGFTTYQGKIVTGIITSLTKQEYRQLSGG